MIKTCKRIFLPLFFMLVVTGCANGTTSTPQVAPAITVSPTLVSSTSNSPGPTVEPSPVTDPNKPDGAMGKDKDGNWYKTVKTEKGNTLTYTWDKERNSWDRLIFNGAAWEWDKQTSNEIKAQTNNVSDGEQLLTNVYIDSAISGEQLLPTLTHHDNVDPKNAVNWTVYFQSIMSEAMGKKGMLKDPKTFETAPWFLTHDYHFDFFTPDGKQQQWGLWDKSSITVHIMGNYDELKANMKTNGFTEAKSLDYGPKNDYMVKIWTENGILFVDIAPSLRPATAWTQKQIMEMVMFGPTAIMEQGGYLVNQSDSAKLPVLNPQSGITLSKFVLNQDKFKLIDYGPPQ